MRSTSRKLLLSLSTFIFALVTLFGATFAWFTAADTATVTSFNLSINSGDNLLIKNSAGTFVTNLTAADVLALYNAKHSTTLTDLDEVKLSPLTSKDGETFYLEQKTTTYADSARRYTPGAAGMFYLDLDITIRALVPMDVHLLSGTTAMFVSTVSRAGAYRASFYDNTTLLKIWESDAPVAANDSLERAGNFITPSGPAAGLDLGGQTTTSALYNYESAAADSTVNSRLLQNMAAYSGTTPTTGTHANDKTITVRIWIEGWDILTTDDLKTDSLAVNLRFIGVTI
ncbi:MAG TPA: hypothetical protein PLR26_06345 [Bacilli bacterium]|mgnify:CR=1 FL=1|nr:hypothetical protein [Bacilli bacterium]